MEDSIQPNELHDWLAQLRDFRSDRESRESLLARMRSIGAARLFPILGRYLSDEDSEVRCLVAETLFRIDPSASVDLLLPLLDDPEWVVRVEICGLLHDIADQRAIQTLLEKLKSDPNPMVRNTAAYALGGIGSPDAIPALIKALDDDHEYDELGHSATSCAATALDKILKTNHTQIAFPNGLCTMQPNPTDLGRLKSEAMDLYRNQ